MEINRCGANRTVILTRRWAIKVPTLRRWRDFLFGLLNNMNEAEAGTRGYVGLCPVRFACPGGLFIVMPRVRTLTAEEFAKFDYSDFCTRHACPAEPKHDSFGWLGDKVVCVDYGWR